ncbi:MAG TPA: autotransporter-associated beta strand repeat-containing protein, partial [Candidatus Saccharimonadales bacterium]|nr:autotransporter-associated beta strand repeat-containing protein [Candidatus Saccharimonadales bacterium]
MKTSISPLPSNPKATPRTLRPRGLASTVAMLALVLSVGPAAKAAVRNWAGTGADHLWATALNWDVGPVSGDSLVFGAALKQINTNNIATSILGTFSGLTLNASGFALYGTQLTNSVGIQDNNGSNSINFIQTLTGPVTITNNAGGLTTTIGAAITNNGFTLNVTGPGNVTLSGVVGGTNAASIAPTQGSVTTDLGFSGTLRLAAANTFFGGVTNYGGGTIQLGNNGGIPSGAGKGDVEILGTLDMDGFSPTLNGLYGSGNIINSAGGGTYTLTVGNNATNVAGTFAGSFAQNTGTIALTKVNTNVFTLNGPGSFTGPLTISAGTFIMGVNGSTSSTNIIVTPGALLDVSAISGGMTLGYGALTAGRTTNPPAGTYDINGSLVNNAGPMVIYKGGAAGTMAINGSLTLNSGSIIQFDLGNTLAVGSGSNDLVTIKGTLTLNGGAIVLNPAAGSFNNSGSYVLISNLQPATVIAGTLSSMTLVLPRGANGTLGVDANDNLIVTIAGTGAAGNLTWSGANVNNWDVQASQAWINGLGQPDYFYNLDNVTFNDSGNASVNVATGVSPGFTTFSNTVEAYTLSGSGAITGAGGLTKYGTNLVILQTPNAYTGDTTVSGGALVEGTQTGTPAANIDLYFNVAPGNLFLNGGGFYQNDAANTTVSANFNQLTIGPGASGFGQHGRQSGSTINIQINQISRPSVGGTLDVTINTKAGNVIGMMISNTPPMNGILGGWATWSATDWLVPLSSTSGGGYGATGLGNTGAGTTGYMTNTAPSTWVSTSNISLSASPTAPVAASATINSLKILAASLTNSPGVTLTIATGGILMPITTGGAASIAGGALLGATNADLVVNDWNVGSPLTIGSVIQDNTNGAATIGSGLTLSGQGTLILTNNNTYSGPTYINNRTMVQFGGATPTWYAASTLQIGGGGASGGISNSSAIYDNGLLSFNRTDVSEYSGIISGLGGVKQLGIGATILPSDNTYSGATTIAAGTLQIGTGGSTGSFSNSMTVANAGTLLINRSGTITYPGAIGGLGLLVQQGPGTVILTGTNTYTGATVINGGTLALAGNGSISNSLLISNVIGSTFDASAVGGVTLNGAGGGQVLAGGGQFNGSVTAVANTRISPGGDSILGTNTFNNNLTLSGGTLSIDVNYPSWDAVSVGGTLNLGSGTLGLNNLGGSIPNGTYLIASAANVTGSAANLSPPTFNQAGQALTLSNNATGLYIVVSTAVAVNLTWTGDGASDFWDVGTSTDWNNGTGPAVFKNGNNVTFDATGAANPNVNIDANVSPGTVTVNSASDYTFQGTGSISQGSLTKMGADTLNILTVNSYAGGTSIQSGTVAVGNGATSGSLGTGAVANNSALTVNIPDVQAISGPISGTGSLTLNAGQLNLTGNNSGYGGAILINSGTLQVGSTLPGGSPSGTLGTGSVTDNSSLVFN